MKKDLQKNKKGVNLLVGEDMTLEEFETQMEKEIMEKIEKDSEQILKGEEIEIDEF